jgi:hypothetical protein
MVIYPQFLVLEVSTTVEFAPGPQREMLLPRLKWFNYWEGIKAVNSTNFYLFFFHGCVVVAPITPIPGTRSQ